MMRLTEDQRDWQFWINDQYADFQPSRESLQRLLDDRMAVRQAAQEAARALANVHDSRFFVRIGPPDAIWNALTKLKALGVEP